MKCKYKEVSLNELKNIVSNSTTYSDVMRALGYTNNRGNSYSGLRDYIKSKGIDVSHFKGKAHGNQYNAVYRLDDMLTENSSYTNLTRLKLRVLKAGLLEYKCQECGISEWNRKPIILQLHHINGDNRDNRLENLMLLCPNCHSQTANYSGKKRSGNSVVE